jgi:hypothetical protein
MTSDSAAEAAAPTDAPVSDEEFYQQALAGGASRHAVTGTVPDRGYMVGGARDLANQPFPEIKHPVDQFTLDHVRHHARELRDRFGADSMVHQGAWREDDSVVLDASEQIPTYSSAVTAAKMRGERAVYDVRRGRDLHTKDVQVKN